MVHLVPDVMAGVDALLNLATEPGDGVVINTPVYPPFLKHIGFARRRVVEVPLVQLNGRWELDFAGLEAAFAAGARGYLLCNPHNPTGRVFSAADLGRIAALAERYEVLVMADEIHASLTLPGVRHTPFVSLGGAAAEHGVTLASASKAFNVAGLKGAVAVAGSATTERLLARLPESCHYGAGLFGVLASLAAWSSGADWLDALLGQLDHARAEFGRLLGERLPGPGMSRRRRATWPGWTAPLSTWARNRQRCSWTAAGWRSAAGSTSARRATASSGSPSAPAARCCPPSWTGWRRPRG